MADTEAIEKSVSGEPNLIVLNSNFLICAAQWSRNDM
jgi:hypothetical protein